MLTVIIRLLATSVLSAVLAFSSFSEVVLAQSPDIQAEAKRDLKQIDCEIAAFSEEAAKLEKVRLTRLATLLQDMKRAGVTEAALKQTAAESFPILSALYNGGSVSDEHLLKLVETHGGNYAQGKLDDQVVVLGGRLSAYARRYSKDAGTALFKATKTAKNFMKMTNLIGLGILAYDLTKSANVVWMSQMKSEEMKRVVASSTRELNDVEGHLKAVTSLISTLLDSREGTVSRWRRYGAVIPDDYFTEGCEVEDEGFNGVWRVKPELGVSQGTVLQIEDDKFWIKIGDGMDSCSVLHSQFDLVTRDQVIGSYASSCGDMNVKGKVAMQKVGDEYSLALCISASTAQPEDCRVGDYYWAAERAGDLALK